MTTVSLHVPESVGAQYVAALRRLVTELPPIPAGILLAKLRKSGLVVLGQFSEARAQEIVARGRAEGLSFTAREGARFDRSLVLESLGAPPLERCERPVIEAVFRPSFAPELVLRLSPGELTAFAASARVVERLHSAEPWLWHPYDEPTRPMIDPHGERAPLEWDPSLLELHAAARERADLHDHAVQPGVVALALDGSTHELATWSPSLERQPHRHKLLFQLLRLADGALSDRTILSAVVQAFGYLRPLADDEAFIVEADLVAERFHCCGDEDLLPFRCRGCDRLMVLCYECDTLYPDLHGLNVRAAWPAPCPTCGASTEGAHDPIHRSRRPAWKEAGLEHLLRVER